MRAGLYSKIVVVVTVVTVVLMSLRDDVGAVDSELKVDVGHS